MISPVCQSSLLQFIKDQDTLLLFSGPNSREKREKMTLKISLDQGQNWTYSKLIHEGASSYSDLVQIDSNTLGVLYEKGSEGIFFSNSFWRLTSKNSIKKPTEVGLNKFCRLGFYQSYFYSIISPPHMQVNSIINSFKCHRKSFQQIFTFRDWYIYTNHIHFLII